MDDELGELAERLRTATIAHGAPAGKSGYRLLYDPTDHNNHTPGRPLQFSACLATMHTVSAIFWRAFLTPLDSKFISFSISLTIHGLSESRLNRSRQRTTPSTRVQPTNPFPESPSSESSESLFSTPSSVTSHYPREVTSPSRRPPIGDGSPRGSVPLSLAPLQIRQIVSGPVPALIVSSQVLTDSTPPTPTSVRSQGGHRKRPVVLHQKTPPRASRDQKKRPVAPDHEAQPPESGPEPAATEKDKDAYGLEHLTHLVALEDPDKGTKRKIHFHWPGQQGPNNRWYLVVYGREVGVFNDWYVLYVLSDKVRTRLIDLPSRSLVNAAVSGVSGCTQQSVENEGIAYLKFIEALHAHGVCIANNAPPYIANRTPKAGRTR